MQIVPDTKDWTHVLSQPCTACGFDAAAVDRDRLGATVRAQAVAWREVLRRDDARARPEQQTWSPLEYTCHVRDVHLLFAERIRLMLAEDDPRLANWDQDETAEAARYAEQDPTTVDGELVTAAEDIAAVFDGLTERDWDRPGRRSNGSVFTVDSLSRYYLHDVVHHLHDVC
ncbi:MAG: DinB family protein [Geodermatophilaceae bacterium]|nr:DinB family protein [Geodermatophilaceae bacterium]